MPPFQTISDTEQHILDYDGCPIHYWLAGEPHGPLVVFTHGAAMDHRMFGTQVAALTPHYRVLLWDVRGHGQSRPAGGEFSVRRAAEDLKALLDHMGYEQATLVGHSMGGYIGQELLLHDPERVSALVTINCTCLTLEHPKAIDLSMQLSPELINLLPYPLVTWQTAWFLSTTPEVRTYIKEMLSEHSKEEFVAIWSAVMNCIHVEPDYQIQQPVLVTYGEHDYLGFGIMKEQARAWAARDPNCRSLEIPAAGHNAQQENPSFFNTLLLNFLREHVPATEKG